MLVRSSSSLRFRKRTSGAPPLDNIVPWACLPDAAFVLLRRQRRRLADPTSARHAHHRQDRDAGRRLPAQPEAKVRSTTFDPSCEPLPAIALLRDGDLVVVAKADDKKILLQVPNEPRPSLLGCDEFVSIWNRKLVMTGAARWSILPADRGAAVAAALRVAARHRGQT